MPLFRSKNAVIFFVHIPKTGGTSVEQALRKTPGVSQAIWFPHKNSFSKCTLQHMDAEVHKVAIPPAFYDWGFAIVRNPYARIASEYRMKVIDAGYTDSFDIWWEFEAREATKNMYRRDNHIRAQNQFITSNLDVYRFEDGLQKPVADACARLGVEVPAEIPHARKSTGARIPATTKALKSVYDFYIKDFKMWGYEPHDYLKSFELIEVEPTDRTEAISSAAPSP